MVSPYLRRRLRSLEEIKSEPRAEGRAAAAGGLAVRRPAFGDFASSAVVVARTADGESGDPHVVSVATTRR